MICWEADWILLYRCCCSTWFLFAHLNGRPLTQDFLGDFIGVDVDGHQANDEVHLVLPGWLKQEDPFIDVELVVDVLLVNVREELPHELLTSSIR